MKQTVLSIQVFKGSDKLFDIPQASSSNIQSCIDLWHSPGTEIKLVFDEVEVHLPSAGDNAHNV